MALRSTSSASPSPVGPLLILGLLLFVLVMHWYISFEPPLVGMAENVQSFSLSAILLLPVLVFIVLQFSLSPRKSVLSSLSENSITISTVFLAGTLVLLLVLIWLRSILQEVWEAL
ncbi:hypothetical protein O6H91_Y505200 [Diphasiastrum complanatum]|nr:hypothetical protein O6H91_Y549400 [Diphasiastrum complanatum]KAJ7197106.1 hypothetical protein O6H91_Y505200 [Diphasiastrum complanatum]